MRPNKRSRGSAARLIDCTLIGGRHAHCRNVGDGIGPEITAATLCVLNAASDCFGLNIQIEEHLAGHESLLRTGPTPAGQKTGREPKSHPINQSTMRKF